MAQRNFQRAFFVLSCASLLLLLAPLAAQAAHPPCDCDLCLADPGARCTFPDGSHGSCRTLIRSGVCLGLAAPAQSGCDVATQTPALPEQDEGLESQVPESAEMAQGSVTFEGCFTFWPAGPCRDVFREDDGTLWICKSCGTTKNPPGGCSILTGSGFWCS